MENGIKYAVIKTINHNDNEFLLVTELQGNEEDANISDEFIILMRDETKEYLKEIEDDMEYELLKEVFERKLEQES